MMQKEIKLLLVDDHSIVRWGIRSLIDRTPGLFVCGEAGTLTEAYQLVKELMPDIVLLDIKLPDGDGAAGCREIKKIDDKIKVIMLTAYAEDSIVLETVKSGADGYLLKNIESKTIIKAIQDVAAGISVLDSTVVGKMMNVVKRSSESEEVLTPQEKKILDYLSQGKTNKEIGEALFIAEKTVRNNVSRIMKKINVSNRTEAAIYWQRQKSLE
ncbi:response regulator [Alkaliphilus transvaalensis]|uniref:response regulator n=1 Tax=Alkaliphilus transvaalensis TaxID=114628 RepID=UPI00047D620F|nr:response regulator transcription factor [Alkaliphilus transvaalensis]